MEKENLFLIIMVSAGIRLNFLLAAGVELYFEFGIRMVLVAH